MAKQPGYQSRSTNSGTGELKSRLLFVLGALIVYRIGSFIPLPGIDAAVLAQLVEQQKGTIIDMLNMFSGGALSRASILALGIMPYISASIVMQLLATPNMLPQLVPNIGFTFYFTAVVSLVTGTMFLMWLGEQITERGIGNGISILVFGGIVAGLPHAIIETVEQARQGQMHPLVLLLIAAIVFAVTYFVVFVERGQRRIRVEYAKRQQGRQILGGHSTHLPLKVNMANVMPAIFASSIILFPATLTQWFGQNDKFEWLNDLSMLLNPGQPLYLLVYAVAIIFFSFFYTAMQYNPRDTADNLKKSGAFIPGIRPGEQTSRYIDKVMTRLTLIGGLYVTFVCLVPYIMTSAWDVKFYFGGTSLLIVVVVIMDFIVQVQSHLMSSQYESALKKANLKGFGQ